MRRVVLFAAVGALLALFLASCSGGGADQASSSGEGVKVGHAAPDFTLPSAGGTKVQLSDFKGKPVLLYFSMGPG